MNALKRSIFNLLVLLSLPLLTARPAAATALQQQPTQPNEAPQDGSDAATATPSKESESDATPADDDRLNVYERVEVRQRADDLTGFTGSASEGSTGYLDLQRRPITRAGELLETAPGMIATQHSGGGKANQYFVRGFNLDHGTDFSVTVAGVPVNMPSHGHGQGYADLSFLIPELVDRVAYRKGTYYADTGDFSAAGAVEMRMRRSLDGGLLQLTGGSYDLGRVLAANSFEAGGGDLVAALDLSVDDGPWARPDDFEKLNGLIRYECGDAGRGFSLTAMGYDGSWLSTDQIPRREVQAGRLGRYDLIDDGPRGSTERYSLSAELHRGSDSSLTSLSGYVMSYDFSLISNFTYQLESPQLGDQFEQVDERIVAGLRGRHEWLGSLAGRSLENRVGFDLRSDTIDNGLFRTRDLERFETVRQDSIDQLGAGLWIDSTVRWNRVFRSRIGLRADLFDADVDSRLAANSGSTDDTLLSPNLSLLIGPFGDATEYFVNFGTGYHSNDARGTTLRVNPASGGPAEPVRPLVKATGAELGFRTLVGDWTTSLTVFGLELDSELVFVGDGGATEASRPSRRRGLEWANYAQLNRWLEVDADFTWTDAEFSDDDPVGQEIPGAISRTVAAGISITDLGRFSGSLRWRYFADIPLIEDNSVTWNSSSLVNAAVRYALTGTIDLSFELFNLLDRDDSDVEYFYASRLVGEPEDGVEDVHFHPTPRRNGRITLQWRF